MRLLRHTGERPRWSKAHAFAASLISLALSLGHPDVAQAASSNDIDYGVWAGWVADQNTFTAVYGSWKEPKINCAGQSNTVVGGWIGFDGWDSDTVEQAGTSAHCINGVDQHYAWWEFYPAKAIYLPANKYDVEAGDVMNAALKGDGKTITLTLTNKSTQHPAWRFTTTQTVSSQLKMASVDMSSAEWAVEAPDNANEDSYPIASFAPYYFYNCSAVTNGKVVPLSALQKTHAEIKGSARISNVGKDGKSFSVTSAK